MTAAPPPTSAGLLAALAIPRNEAAWVRFIAAYRGYVESLGRRAGLQAADVDEVTSRVLAALCQAFPAFRRDPAKKFRGYLATAVGNAIRSYWRESRARPGTVGTGGDDSLVAVAAPGDSAADGFAGQVEDGLRAGLTHRGRAEDAVREKIDPKTWKAFVRTAIDGAAAKDVAAELEMTVGAVYMAKSRTLKLLKDELTLATDVPHASDPDPWTHARPTPDSP